MKDFKNADYVRIGNFLSLLNWDTLFENCVMANDMYGVFCDAIHSAIEVYVPNKREHKGAGFILPHRLR